MDEAVLAHVVRELKRLDEVKAAYLFGSQITGKAKEYSDVDICVLTKPEITKNMREGILSNSSRDMDISMFWDLPPNIRMRVIKEGRLLFEKDELLLHRAKVKTIRQYLDFKPLLARHLARVLS